MAELTADCGVGIAFITSPLNVSFVFRYANFCHRQPLEELVQLISAAKGVLGSAVLGLSRVEGSGCFSASSEVQ